MKIWKNTNTLDDLEFFKGLDICKDPSLAELAIIGSKNINLDEMPNLKGIFKCGVGVDNVPFEKAHARGIKIGLPSLKTKEIIYEETANFASYLIMRSVYDDHGDFAKWHKKPREAFKKLTLLIVGNGNIGKRVKEKMTPFTNVTTFDKTQNTAEELSLLVENADLISIHLPLNEETSNLFDKELIKKIKNGSTLINTARGNIVDEESLYGELKSGRIKAAFDVFWEEPYRGKLMNLDTQSFLVTPHVSSSCADFIVGLGEDFENFKTEFNNND